jgi:protein-disulfide isomerase
LRISSFLLTASLLTALGGAMGCHAQPPAGALKPAVEAATGTALSPSGTALSAADARRIEVLLRSKASLPPGSTVSVGLRTTSAVPGWDQVLVTVTSEEGSRSHPVTFLISPDSKTIAQFTQFTLPTDPRTMVPIAGRPHRGGPATAPVLIVGFDDLECPFCARLHATIFPALTERYGDLVHIVYRDFPLDIHPWAQRAAVDVNCVGAQSAVGYWSTVDFIHAHADEIGADPKDAKAQKTLARAQDQLDNIAREQGKARHVDEAKLNACLTKQDTTDIEANKHMGEQFGVDSTPVLFINGAKIDGAVDLSFIEKVIDTALVAEGRTPPPYPVAATPSAK